MLQSMSRAFFAVLCASLASLSLAQYPGAKRVPNDWRTGFNSITIEDAKPILTWLAGPQFNGRAPDTGDFFAAAGYVSGYLHDLGLEPGGDNGSFLQRFTVSYGTVIPGQTELRSADGSVRLPYGQDFAAAAAEDLDLPIKFAFVHASKEADATKLDWSQLKGRLVIVSRESMDNPLIKEKFAKGAQAVDALALVYPSVLTSPAASTNFRQVGVKGIVDPSQPPFTRLILKPKAIEAIVAKAGAPKFLAKSASEATIELSEVPFTIQIHVTKDEKPACNVVAIMRGADPTLRDECVVVGSHLDHLGYSDRGIRFGADDNGSGCTANMLLARAIIRNPVKPKRTVVFVFYDHEETGLYGSLYYVNKPPIPISNTVACFNMDMVGRNENRGPEIAENNVNVVYPGIVQLNSPDFYDLMAKANQFVNLRLKPDREDRTFRTDTGNYVRKGVPTIKVFTGEHEDYHQPGDTVDKINWEKMTNIAKWVYLGVEDLASTSTRPKFATKPFALPPYLILEGHTSLPQGATLPKRARLVIDILDANGKTVGSFVKTPIAPKDTYEYLLEKVLVPTGSKFQLQFEIRDGDKPLFRSSSSIPLTDSGWARAQDVALVAVSP
jgi:hypothetical protein